MVGTPHASSRYQLQIMELISKGHMSVHLYSWNMMKYYNLTYYTHNMRVCMSISSRCLSLYIYICACVKRNTQTHSPYKKERHGFMGIRTSRAPMVCHCTIKTYDMCCYPILLCVISICLLPNLLQFHLLIFLDQTSQFFILWVWNGAPVKPMV